jgi:hypothetical protein
MKKNLSQTETGKKSFIRLLELVKAMPDDPAASQLENFLIDVLNVYEKHQVDGHVSWENNTAPKDN